jgi:cell division septation protein DedD
VTDLTHDASDDGFHEIQLSGKQLVFLFMATTVVSVVIFLCGVLVGRGVRAERAVDNAAAITDPPVASAPAPTDTVADAGPPAAEPPTPPAEGEAPLSYKARLEGNKPATETLKSSAEPSTAALSPAPQPRPAPTRTAPPNASRETWVVQIVALRDRGMASSIVQRLSGKGYPAFVVNPTAGTPAPVFKVQVGRYADRDEAEQVARRLEKEEQFKPWVSR